MSSKEELSPVILERKIKNSNQNERVLLYLLNDLTFNKLIKNIYIVNVMSFLSRGITFLVWNWKLWML